MAYLDIIPPAEIHTDTFAVMRRNTEINVYLSKMEVPPTIAHCPWGEVSMREGKLAPSRPMQQMCKVLEAAAPHSLCIHTHIHTNRHRLGRYKGTTSSTSSSPSWC